MKLSLRPSTSFVVDLNKWPASATGSIRQALQSVYASSPHPGIQMLHCLEFGIAVRERNPAGYAVSPGGKARAVATNFGGANDEISEPEL
jgi:hypothetical protein